MWNPNWPWSEIGLSPVQENLSKSKNRTFRGMHWQLPPFEQGKLVTVLDGKIVDYVVDLRRSSASFGELLKFELDSDSMSSLWVPPGFAHGFEALLDDTLVVYQVTKRWSQEHERSFSPMSMKNLEKSGRGYLLSDKDSRAPGFSDLAPGDIFD